LLNRVNADELAELIALARVHGMRPVLAGSLTREAIREIVALAPDYIAVRGAVCRAGRTGTLDPLLVRQIGAAIRGDGAPVLTA
jgi:uncharacterized protein (UPF0264 family)